MRLARFAGGPPLREEAVAVDVAAHASACVARWDDLEGGPDRYLAVASEHGAFGANRRFFVAIKDLERPRAAVEHVVEGDRLRLRADAYAYVVCVATPDESVRFSDNYVELEPGEERTIAFAGGDPGALEVRWR